MELSSAFLALLSCPISGEKLKYDRERKILVNEKDGLMYPIIDGIPLLLKSEARELNTHSIKETEIS